MDYEKEHPSRLLDMLDLSESDCAHQELDTLKTLLTDIFEMHNSELGHSNVVQHVQVIVLQYTAIGHLLCKKERIAQLIKQAEQQGIVKPSCSPWALVPKKDRFCVCLNVVTKKDVYPLRRIDDTLGQAKYCTTLDLFAGYWQVELDPESQAKTVFTFHRGSLYTCLCLSVSLSVTNLARAYDLRVTNSTYQRSLC